MNAARHHPATRTNEGGEPEPDWLCSGEPLFFVRDVYVTGDRTQIGYVCEGTDTLKYHTPDEFGANELGRRYDRCAFLWYNARTRTHFVERIEATAADDEDASAAPTDESP